MPQLLTESSSAPVKSGNNWRAVLITPGKGSSGVYTEKMLKEYGPKAFKKGTHSYVDHPRDESDIRSPKNLIGVLAEDARYEKGVGLVAELSVMPHWKEFVEAVAPHTGLSIYAMGEGNYNDDGEVVVESLVPHTQNSVDLVSYPGRQGSKLADKLYEAAISMVKTVELAERDLVKWVEDDELYYGQVAYVMTEGVFPFEGDPLAMAATAENPIAVIRVWDMENGEWMAKEDLRAAPVSSLTQVSALGEAKSGENGTAAPTVAETVTNMKEGNSDMELKELSDQLAELPNLVAAAVAEALAPAVETEEKEEVDVAAVAEAMVEADLPQVSRKAVYESLRAGADLTEAIENQKAFVESVKSHFKEEAAASSKNEETVIVNTQEKAASLSEILNVKVGA
jgi:predicted DNA-binding protein YlxM (UPF0122 family)